MGYYVFMASFPQSKLLEKTCRSQKASKPRCTVCYNVLFVCLNLYYIESRTCCWCFGYLHFPPSLFSFLPTLWSMCVPSRWGSCPTTWLTGSTGRPSSKQDSHWRSNSTWRSRASNRSSMTLHYIALHCIGCVSVWLHGNKLLMRNRWFEGSLSGPVEGLVKACVTSALVSETKPVSEQRF